MLIEDECDCPECEKNREAFNFALDYAKKLEAELYEANEIIDDLEQEKQQVLDDYQELGKDLHNNFISKQVILDKIESLNIKITYIESQYTNGGQNCDTEYLSALYKKQILQEILKGDLKK